MIRETLLTLEERMAKQDARVLKLNEDFESLKMLLEKNNTSLEEFVDLAKAFKFGLKILGLLERASVFISKIAIASATVWGIWKFLIKEAIAASFRHYR